MKKAACAFLLIIPLWLQAQVKDRVPVQPQSVREADVMFSKRVWRVIDLREKQNMRAMWPAAPLNRILYEAVQAGSLKPYRTDSLRSVIPLPDFLALGTQKILNRKFPDPNDDSYFTVDTLIDPFHPEEDIDQLMVLEDWYFDRKLSTTIPRIIAIAPLYHLQAAGYDVGLQTLCWLRYNDRNNLEFDCRDLLVKTVMFNKENSRSHFTYDDWFEQRMFSSFIVKVSNVYDTSILLDPEVKNNGLEALIEAERLKRTEYERDANQFED